MPILPAADNREARQGIRRVASAAGATLAAGPSLAILAVVVLAALGLEAVTRAAALRAAVIPVGVVVAVAPAVVTPAVEAAARVAPTPAGPHPRPGREKAPAPAVLEKASGCPAFPAVRES